MYVLMKYWSSDSTYRSNPKVLHLNAPLESVGL